MTNLFFFKEMKKVICIGSATRDIFFSLRVDDQEGDKICLPAGAKFYTDDYREMVGGGAVNVGASLQKLGLRAFVFARTDKTMTGKWIQKQIGRLKLKKNYMQQNGRIPSETSIVIFDRQENDRVILRSGDSVENFNLAKAFKKFREKVDWIYLSSQKKNNLENLDLTIQFANEKKAGLALNPSSYQLENNRDDLLERLGEVNILFLNFSEACLLTAISAEEAQPEELCQEILNQGTKIIVLTDGERGAWVASFIKKEFFIFHLPAETEAKVVDTTGAGDAFNAGFLATYIEAESDYEMDFSEKLKRSLAAGIANSTAVIGEIGAVNGSLKPSALRRQIKKLLRKTTS